MKFSYTKGEEKLSKIPFSTLINKILSVCKNKQLSFAAWKKPEDDFINLIISSPKSSKNIQNQNFKESGFILNPYDCRNPQTATWIRPDLFLQYDGGRVQVNNIADLEFETIFNDILNEVDIDSSKVIFHEGTESANLKDTKKDVFLGYTEKVIEEISQGHFEKVVPARIKTVNLNQAQTPGVIFKKLTDTYKSAFKSIVSHPVHGTWLGASPELFGQWIDEKQFYTISLAGTQRIPKDKKTPVTWNKKELEEQEMVTRFIIDRAKTLGISMTKLSEPSTVKAGSLNHLKSEIQLCLKEDQTIMDVVYQLHPTPAVCGLPRNAADKFINENEPFKRGLYAGFLGPVNIQNSSDIYVNLRCMKLHSGKAYLFAGAGITLLSSPEKEWLETDYKCETVNRILSELD